MRIAYIAAGAGGMYCGSCIRDNALARVIGNLGHEIALIPTYTPMRTDDKNVSMERVFYNGINVWLQQKYRWARDGNRWLDWLLDRPGIVNYLAKVNASTNARELGEMTVSMLRGADGYQQKELQKLIDWLANDYRPEIVKITNTMLAGMAKPLKKALGVPVLCAVQGEDIFLDDLIEPYRSQAMDLLREKVRDLDGIIATSEFYRDYMTEYLDLPQSRIHVVLPGINTEGHGKVADQAGDSPFFIGYLARICPEKGLHLLVDAVAELAGRIGKQNIRLKVAGYLGKRDFDYFEKVTTQVQNAGLTDIFEHVGEVDREEKIAFLNSLHVLSVPTPYREPKGLFLLEALANGVPVVQPNHGIFPEMIAATGGGLLVEPNKSADLADGLQQLYENPQQRREMGQRGKAAVHQRFTDQHMGAATLDVFQSYL